MTRTPDEAAEIIEIPLPATTLNAFAWGPVDGPLVVCLHGFPDTAWTWRHLGPHLAARGHRVVAPFTRGYAPSGVPADRSYHVGALMHDAVAIHEYLGGDEQSALIGHDWGAITANGLAANDHSPYGRIVTMAVPPLPAMSGRAPIGQLARQARLSWYTLFNQFPLLPERSTERLIRHLWSVWSPGFDATEDIAHVLESLPSGPHRSAAFGYYRAIARPWSVPEAYRPWQQTWTGTPLLPTLCLHGADDGCLQAAYAERAGTALPDTEVVIVPDAGHFLQLEQPAIVNELVSAYLER